MSDIVDRLRGDCTASAMFEIAREAADEIDRLREEIEIMIAGDRLRAERDRLREALEQIAEANWLDDPQEARRIAKAALANTANPAEAPTTDQSASWSAREP